MKTSIVNRLRRFLLIPLIAILALSAVLWTFNIRELNNYNTSMSNLLEKRNQLRLVQHNIEGLVSELRGFMAMRNDSFLTLIDARQADAQSQIEAYSQLPLTGKERTFIEGIKRDLKVYTDKIIPEGISLARAANYQAINTKAGASQTGYTNFVNSIRNRLETQMGVYTDDIEQVQKEHQRYIMYSLSGFLSLLIMILILSYWVTTRFGREIGKPLEVLTASARRISQGKYTLIPPLNHDDELGELEHAFNQMVHQMEEKESNLLSQNDELTAHQEELYAQQVELEEAVQKLTDKENILLRRNQLSTSLATEIEVESMLKQVLDSMLDLTGSQIGAAIILDHELKDRFVSKGIAHEQIDILLAHIYEGMSGRAIAEKSVLTLERIARTEESGHHASYPVHDLYMPLLNRDGEVVALLVVTRLNGYAFTHADLDEFSALTRQISLAVENAVVYKKTQQTSLLNQAILNSALEGICLIGPQGELLAVNHSWCDMYGVEKPEDIQTLTMAELSRKIHQRFKQPDEMFAFYHQAINGTLDELQELTVEIIQPTYRVIRMYYRKVINDHAGVIGWVIVCRDITREYEIDRMKSEFVSTVSHELRTPLSSILGFVEIMLQRKINPDKQTRYLNTIYKEARRLTNLINDFLDVQRMESGHQEYQKEMISLRNVVEEVISAHHSDIHPIRLECRTSQDTICADHEKIQQVVTNLLSNAIKYSPNGGTVTLTIDMCAERPQDVCLCITDEGLGIPEDAIPHLFEKFYRVDNSDRRKIGGTGLGLAICSEIIKAHNGLIHVSSTLGSGSTFTISLPTAITSSHGLPYVPPAPESTNGTPIVEKELSGHILIVEDDESLRTYLAEELGNFLTQKGITIFHALNGEQALQSIADDPPLLLILDIMLGEGKDGWEILQEIKRQEAYRSIPIVISSALEEREKGIGYGISEYLIKPYAAEKLTSTVWNLLQQQEAEGHVFIPADQEKD
ncbi:ATP-binding protein [Aneurinibacillus uraniidurans]|uniref:ATP-binding protein n=1 Tax=Aneurinibacillus uraniidurans TaxID=2966586 RepID=UPI00234AD7BC|nr:ATP-binding protein [Aneurinibacillus sp. B1]WCN36984.1 ATP-binding protein [Aneurinibacillus sp. B1]